MWRVAVFALLTARAHSQEIGAGQAVRGRFPWHATIRVGKTELYGGSLISDRHVITAANYLTTSSQVKACVGKVDFRYYDDYGCWMKVLEIHIHPEFKRTENFIHTADLALLKLHFPVTFNDYVAPIQLPTGEDVLSEHNVNATLGVVGLGSEDDSQFRSLFVMYGFLRYIGYSRCDYAKLKGNTTHYLCTEDLQSDTFVRGCNGDVGSGVFGDPHCMGRNVLFGVLSNKPKRIYDRVGKQFSCAFHQNVIITRISAYAASWISSHIKSTSDGSTMKHCKPYERHVPVDALLPRRSCNAMRTCP